MTAKTDRLQEVLQLRKSLRELEQSKDRAEGSLEQLMHTFQEDFNVTSINSAKQLLRKMNKTLDTKSRVFGAKLTIFKKRWQRYL